MYKFRVNPVLFLLASFAVLPMVGQRATPIWESDEGRLVLPKGDPRTVDRFPRLDSESLWADSLVPRSAPPLGIAPGKISAQVLQHPLSKKESKLLQKAQRLSESGDRAKAIEILRAASQGASAYVHSRLGTEYLKAARPDLATPELEETARLMPGESAHHANLSYAYRLMNRFEEAEREARRALELDHSSAPAHFLLGSVLFARRGSLDEVIDHLKLARASLRSARLALAQVYAVTGLPDASRRELASYLSEASARERAIAEQWFTDRGFLERKE